jgi:hypothetical protein
MKQLLDVCLQLGSLDAFNVFHAWVADLIEIS